MKSRERLATPSRQHSTMLDIFQAMYSEKSRAFGRGFRGTVSNVVKGKFIIASTRKLYSPPVMDNAFSCQPFTSLRKSKQSDLNNLKVRVVQAFQDRSQRVINLISRYESVIKISSDSFIYIFSQHHLHMHIRYSIASTSLTEVD